MESCSVKKHIVSRLKYFHDTYYNIAFKNMTTDSNSLDLLETCHLDPRNVVLLKSLRIPNRFVENISIDIIVIRPD